MKVANAFAQLFAILAFLTLGSLMIIVSLHLLAFDDAILKVQEIIQLQAITRVPRTPEFVRGVINLRGKVIPVVDLRLRFALEAAAYTERTCIIVVEVAGAGGSVMMGIVVDAVSEVLNIRGADIENTPAFGVRLNTDFILGMAKAAGGIKILLDIDKVLSSEDLVAIRHAA